MSDVVVGLDVHLKNTQVTVMKLNGEIVKRERVRTCRAGLGKIVRVCSEEQQGSARVSGFLLAVD